MSGAVIIGLFGPPLSGKGTLAKELSILKLPHISTGAILRKAAAEGKVDSKVKQLIDEGKLVSDAVLFTLLEARLSEKDCENGFILDGFPRILSQANALEKMQIKFTHIIEISASTDLILNRLQERAAKQGRLDDTESVVRKRINDYYFKTVPVVMQYQSQTEIQFIQINAADSAPHETAKFVLEEMSNSKAKPRAKL